MTEISSVTPDLQASTPEVRLSLTRAGVTGVQKAVRVSHEGARDGDGGAARVHGRPRPGAQGRAHVALPRADRRVDRAPRDRRVAARRGARERDRAQTLGRQGALRSQVRIEAIQSTTRTAPRSGLPSQEISTLIGVATASAEGVRRAVGVRIRGITACPCAQGMVRDHADERLAGLGYGEDARASSTPSRSPRTTSAARPPSSWARASTSPPSASRRSPSAPCRRRS